MERVVKCSNVEVVVPIREPELLMAQGRVAPAALTRIRLYRHLLRFVVVGLGVVLLSTLAIAQSTKVPASSGASSASKPEDCVVPAKDANAAAATKLSPANPQADPREESAMESEDSNSASPRLPRLATDAETNAVTSEEEPALDTKPQPPAEQGQAKSSNSAAESPRQCKRPSSPKSGGASPASK